MQKKKRLIPFSWLPGSWGLKGKVFEEAAAHYYYEGKDLDLKLAEIKCGDDKKEHARYVLAVKRKYDEIDDLQHDLLELDLDVDAKKNPIDHARIRNNIMLRHDQITNYEYDIAELDLDKKSRAKSDSPMEQSEYELAKIEIEYRHGNLTSYECDCKQIALEHPDVESTEYQMAKLAVDLKHEKIDQNEHDKKVATLKEEPWIGIVNQGFEPEKGIGGVYFEFDWNEYWIIFLRMNGYFGNTEDQIIDQWFADVCRSQNVGVNEFDNGSIIPFNGRVVNKPQGQ